MNRRTTELSSATLTVALAAGLATAVPAEAAPAVRITRIHYAQVGTNLNTEYIVFKNTTSTTRWVTRWTIISKPSSANQRYTFPRTKIPAGRTLVLYTGKGLNAPGKRYWGASSPRWDNSGDYAVLKNAAGTTVDTCRYAGGGTTAYC
jgi:hypothetical protein